jgi:archaemetzincin
MKIAILQIGKIEPSILEYARDNLAKAFPKTETAILEETLPLSRELHDSARKQYDSSLQLMLVRQFPKKTNADKILAVTNVDLYELQLNFVFGEAESPGKSAIVSLHRLRPEFYGDQPNEILFLMRAAKEIIHETGHMFGLPHCSDSSCVMSFSNTIHAVDRKASKFCSKCSTLLAKIVG